MGSRHRPPDAVQDSLSILKKQTASVRQLYLAGATLEQLKPKFGLKRLDLLRQRRLCDADAARRAREVQLLCGRDEVSEMPEFH